MLVLPIWLASLVDLIRLAVSVKREKACVIAFPDPDGGGWIAGLYLPPFSKDFSAIFAGVRLRDRPAHTYSYSSSEEGRESIVEGIVKSSSYMPVTVAFVRDAPHNYVDLDDLGSELTYVELEDLKSLAFIAISSTADNWSYMPFVWYDVDRGEFTLTLEATPREDVEGELLVMTLPYKLEDRYSFIVYDQESDDVFLSEGYRGINYQYVSIVRTRALPYFD